jgi:hypothetical protein
LWSGNIIREIISCCKYKDKKFNNINGCGTVILLEKKT